MSGKPIAWITGASAGIGEAIARKLAGDYRLILSGRRLERLAELSKSIPGGQETMLLDFDIRSQKDLQAAWERLSPDWREVDVLINNAGLALGLQPIQNGDPGDWDSMIDTNLKGLLYVSRIVSEGMCERGRGHIINIGSIAGKEAYANGNVYCATKYAVDGLTRGMRIDLLPFGIRVTAIHPGMVESEFSLVRFKGDQERAKKVYQGVEALRPEDIAAAVEFVLKCPPHVNISDMVITPTAQASIHHLIRKD